MRCVLLLLAILLFYYYFIIIFYYFIHAGASGTDAMVRHALCLLLRLLLGP
jgi:hypothetical protein